MGILNTCIRVIRNRSKGHRNKEIEIVIDNRFTKFCFESYVRAFHVYQSVWSPIIGEENLEWRHEENNEEDEFVRLVFIKMIFKKKL